MKERYLAKLSNKYQFISDSINIILFNEKDDQPQFSDDFNNQRKYQFNSINTPNVKYELH